MADKIRLKLDSDAEKKLQDLGKDFIADNVLPEIVSSAKRIVPVDSGDLQDSIHAETSDEGMYVVASTPYAAAVENGTSKMAAQPYLRPALNTTIKG